MKRQICHPHISGLTTPHGAVTSGSRNALRRPLRTNLGPSSTLPGHLTAHGDQIFQNTTRNPPGRRRFLNYSPREVFTQEARPPYLADVLLQPSWSCVNMFCAKHRDRHIYTTCDGWKRHMKEHETVWPCMPYGPLDTAGDGLICALCGSMSPNESHLASHSIGDCGDNSTKLRGVSRRVNLERHLLRAHAVSDDRTRLLANSWKTTLHKKHFACGFCICIFPTIHEQLNHIDMDHFKKGQKITEWSATIVIRGLLLSPNVASWFRCILLSDPYATDRDLHWDWHIIEDLQRRLEMAEEAAETLALEAYEMLTLNLSRQKSNGQPPPISLPDLKIVGQSEETMRSFAVSAECLERNSEHQIEEICQGSEPPWFPDEYRVAGPNTSCSVLDYGFPTNQIDTSEANSTVGSQGVYSMTQKGLPAVSPSGAARSPIVHYLSQTGSASSITKVGSTSAYDSTGTSTHWQAAQSATPSTLQCPGVTNMLRDQPKSYQGPTHDIETAGMLMSDLDDLAQSSSLGGDSFPLGTCDPRVLTMKKT